MKISRIRLAQVLDDRIEESVDTQMLTREIAAYLLSENRTGELDSIMRDVMQLRADRGVIEVMAVDAFPLSDQVRDDIEAFIKQIFPNQQAIIISEVRDPSVIGGTKLILANEQLDISVRSKLNRFKQLTVATGGVQA